jgi:hypothetical protein
VTKKISLIGFLLILLSPSKILGIDYNAHYLIIKNDTFELRCNFELLPDQYSKNIEKGFAKVPNRCTFSYWKFESDKLYLSNIIDCDNKNNIADLKRIFGNDYKNGRIFADWVTGKLISPQGKRTDFFGEYSTHEKQLDFVFDKGVLVSKNEYNNSKTYKSVFTQGKMDTLNFFIYSNINWDSLPEINNVNKRVFLRLITGDDKDSFEVSILKGIDTFFDKEALRVVKSIPEWDVLYILGQPVKMYWSIPVIFSDEMRLRYDKRLRNK